VCTYGSGYPDSCPLCQSPNEDVHHILRCPHASRAKWRSNFVTTLQDCCHSLKTSPILLEILVGGIQAWISSEPFDKSKFPVKYAHLLREQHTIGWSQVFQGRLSTQWALLQNENYDGFPPVRGRNGTSWSRNILCHVFSQWLLFWESRNADRHGRNATSQNIARGDQALRKRNYSTPTKTQFYIVIELFSLILFKNILPNLHMPFGSGLIPTNPSS
jgi:hypothetical protein